MLAWACAMTIWRHLVLAELRAAADRANASDPDDSATPQQGNNAAPAANAAVATASATPV
jgi:hypothetical protein